MNSFSRSGVAFLLLSMLGLFTPPLFGDGPVLRPGWPVTIEGFTGATILNNLATTQLPNGEWVIAAGTLVEVILTDLNGNPYPGWPLLFSYSDIWGIAQGPRLGDMDGDGMPEVAVLTVDRDGNKHV